MSPGLAAEWGEVPTYEASLARTLGPGALPGFLDEVAAHADATVPLARRLFGRWLEEVARVPARAIG